MKKVGFAAVMVMSGALMACSGGDDGANPDGGGINLPPDGGTPDGGTPDTGDVANDFGGAVSVMIGDPNGEGDAIGTPGDRDFYKFEATAGQWLRVFTIANAQGDPMKIDTVIKVYSGPSKAMQISENDDGLPRTSTDSEVIFKAPTTGTYYVELMEYSDWEKDALNQPSKGQPDFSYQLAIAELTAGMGVAVEPVADPGDDAASKITATIGAMNTAIMLGSFKDSADTDVYTLTVPAVQGMPTLNLTTAIMPASTAGYGSTAPNGKLWITNQAGDSILARIDMSVGAMGPTQLEPPVAPGTYLIWLQRGTGASGSNPFVVAKAGIIFQELEAEKEQAGQSTNDTLATAQALSGQANGNLTRYAVRVRLPANADVDYFSFPVNTAGHVVFMSCNGQRVGSGVQGVNVSIRNGSDGVIAQKNETPTAEAMVQDQAVPSTGTYYLRVAKTGQDAEVAGDFVRCVVVVGPKS